MAPNSNSDTTLSMDALLAHLPQEHLLEVKTNAMEHKEEGQRKLENDMWGSVKLKTKKSAKDLVELCRVK